MPTVTVTLSISRTSFTGSTLATDIHPEQNRSYFYQFTGGTDGSGNVTANSETDIVLNVVSNDGGDYEIDKVDFDNNPGNQFKFDKNTNKKGGNINDKKTTDGTFYYDVKMIDQGDKQCKFTCDPKITNVSN